MSGPDFITDNAAPCHKCASTVAGYTLTADYMDRPRVAVRCASCHTEGGFAVSAAPTTAREASAAHRAQAHR
jgi:hypothetical protein